MKDLLTTSQVARLFSVAPHTIRRWTQEGRLVSARTVGGHLRFKREDVTNLLAARGFVIPQPAPPPPAPDFELRVLVVDDETAVHDEFASIFKGEKVRVEAARNGFEASVILALFKPHLVFVDLLLPDVEGFRICQEIRADEKTKGITVVAMTGFRGGEFASTALNAGASACIKKPVDRKAIAAFAAETAACVQAEAAARPGSAAAPSQPSEVSSF